MPISRVNEKNDPRRFACDRFAAVFNRGNFDLIAQYFHDHATPDFIHVASNLALFPGLWQYHEIQGSLRAADFYCKLLQAIPDATLIVKERALYEKEDGSAYLLANIIFEGTWLWNILLVNALRKPLAFFQRWNPFQTLYRLVHPVRHAKVSALNTTQHSYHRHGYFDLPEQTPSSAAASSNSVSFHGDAGSSSSLAAPTPRSSNSSSHNHLFMGNNIHPDKVAVMDTNAGYEVGEKRHDPNKRLLVDVALIIFLRSDGKITRIESIRSAHFKPATAGAAGSAGEMDEQLRDV